MIRALVEQTFDATKKYFVLAGLSTDSKPTTGIVTGSKFIEVDTGTNFAFDEVSGTWSAATITMQDIKDEIDSWLENNIDPDSGYALDRTLSLSNAAAPADMVGDLKSATNQIYEIIEKDEYDGKLYEHTFSSTGGDTHEMRLVRGAKYRAINTTASSVGNRTIQIRGRKTSDGANTLFATIQDSNPVEFIPEDDFGYLNVYSSGSAIVEIYLISGARIEIQDLNEAIDNDPALSILETGSKIIYTYHFSAIGSIVIPFKLINGATYNVKNTTASTVGICTIIIYGRHTKDGTNTKLKQFSDGQIYDFTPDNNFEYMNIYAGGECTVQIEIATGVLKSIDDLKEEMDQVNKYATVEYRTNLFNLNNITEGKFWNGEEEITNVNFCYAIIDDIDPSLNYIISGSDYTCYAVNASNVSLKQYGSAIESLNNVAIDNLPSQTKKLIINFKPSKHPTETYMVMSGANLPSDYIPYNGLIYNSKAKYAINGIIDQSKEIPCYYVGSTRENTSFTALCEALADDANEKYIYIDEGEYDIFSEIGGSAYCANIPSGTTWREISVVVPPNTHVVGIGRVVFNFLPSVADIGNGLDILSPLNVVHPVTVENITINAQNCRYCIHDEIDLDVANYTKRVQRVYRNVKCYKSGSGKAQALGGGICDKTDYLFENCVFESNLDAFTYHDAGNTNKSDANMTLNGCILKGGRRAFRFGNIATADKPVTVNMSGCYLEGAIKIGLETSGSNANQNCVLTMVGCNRQASDIEIELKEGGTNNYPPVVYTW